MKPHDTVIADIIADSQEAAQHRDALDRRQFLTLLATGVGGISGALSALPAFAQLSSGQLQPDTTTTTPLTPVVEAVSENVWDGDRLDEDAVSELIDQAMMKFTGRASAKEAWRDIVLPDDIVGIKINPSVDRNSARILSLLIKLLRESTAQGSSKNKLLSGTGLKTTS